MRFYEPVFSQEYSRYVHIFLQRMANKLIYSVKFAVNRLFLREYRYNRIERHYLRQYYSDTAPSATNKRKVVVFMADGKRRQGGLVDRLFGITTMYKYSKEHGIDFRIYWNVPFDLGLFLVPNRYDWRISGQDISYNNRSSRACFLDAMHDSSDKAVRLQKRITDKFLSRKYMQIHVYSNMDYEREMFGILFNELFKPSDFIQKEVQTVINKFRNNGNSMYISISTRFMELLGDFSEPKRYTVASVSEQERLINGCIEQIKIIRDRHPEASGILVTSDSIRFLDIAQKLERCYVIPGNISHVDVTCSGLETHVKTFVDFFAIAHADVSYLLVSGKMHHSNFSRMAACIYKHPFIEVTF